MKLSKITYSHFNFTLQFIEDAILPAFKGSMFRGSFGWAFRKTICVTKAAECEGCTLQQVCAYFLVFETEIPQNNLWFLKGAKKLSHPFIIAPPIEQILEYKKGETLNVGITLFGNYILLLPHFIKTFRQMGIMGVGAGRKKFKLLKVTNTIDYEHATVICEENNPEVKSGFNIYSLGNGADQENVSEVTLNFITPVRFQKAGNVFSNPASVDFNLIYNSLLRRYYTISHLYCNAEKEEYPSPLDVSDIKVKNNNLHFHKLERYTTRQKKKMEISGFTGSIILSGNLTPFVSLLKAGEKLNIGKNTVFGLGKYKMEINK
ncbi:MAG: CRISPR system precrRNA processing endoribonuclease RAMP protein Cas6 [Melioribacteraceae bacterium]|nr:CRISPR system precrRNA processing endoribonuclease RAMP protein Cas6 [Melioribacteraceae bacterium]